MKKIIILVFLLLGSIAFAQEMTLSTDRSTYNQDDMIFITVTIHNAETTSVQWELEVYLYTEDTTVQIPDPFTEHVLLSAGENKTYSYNISVSSIQQTGTYEIFADLYDSEYEIVGFEISEFTITSPDNNSQNNNDTNDNNVTNDDNDTENSSLLMSLEILVCADPQCTEEKNLFSLNDNVYLKHRSNTTGIILLSTLIYPDSTSQEIVLPTALSPNIAGVYTLEVNSSKQGYISLTRTKSFQVAVSNNQDDEECGNGICEAGEDYVVCPQDCLVQEYCGDGSCNANENHVNCPEDCPSAGNESDNNQGDMTYIIIIIIILIVIIISAFLLYRKHCMDKKWEALLDRYS